MLSGLRLIIDFLQNKISQGYLVKFLYSDMPYPAKDDQEMIDFLQKNMSGDLEIIRAQSLDEWLAWISQASLLISGRFHHSIAAACLGTKFVALNSKPLKSMV